MSDNLVKRLRKSWDADRSIISQTEQWMTERVAAADRIEELEAKLARESDALLMLHAAVVEALQPHADLTRLANVSATLAELKGENDE